MAIRQLLSIFDQLGKLQTKINVYQGPIYMGQPTLSDQTLLCRKPTKIGHIFSKKSILKINFSTKSNNKTCPPSQLF